MSYNKYKSEKQKNMTPMQRFKSGFDILRFNLNQSFKPLSLNKVDPKNSYYTSSSTKGVAADHILIMQGKNSSFAFSFDYIDKEPEQQFIVPSIKMKETIVYGAPLKLKEFKEKLKGFLKSVELIRLSKDYEQSVVTQVKEIFIGIEFDLGSEIDKANRDMQKATKDFKLSLKVDKLGENVALTTANYENALIKSEKELESSAEFIAMQKVLNELKNARKILNNKKFQINQNNLVYELEIKKENAEKELRATEKKVEDFIEKSKLDIPKILTAKLKI